MIGDFNIADVGAFINDINKNPETAAVTVKITHGNGIGGLCGNATIEVKITPKPSSGVTVAPLQLQEEA